MLKVNNKDAKTPSMTSLYSYLGTYFTTFSSVPIVDLNK